MSGATTCASTLTVNDNFNCSRIVNKGYGQPLIYSFNYVVTNTNTNAIYVPYKGYSNVIIHISGPSNMYGIFSTTGIQSGVAFAPPYILNYWGLDYYVYYFTAQWTGGTVLWIGRGTVGQVFNIVEYWY